MLISTSIFYQEYNIRIMKIYFELIQYIISRGFSTKYLFKIMFVIGYLVFYYNKFFFWIILLTKSFYSLKKIYI